MCVCVQLRGSLVRMRDECFDVEIGDGTGLCGCMSNCCVENY